MSDYKLAQLPWLSNAHQGFVDVFFRGKSSHAHLLNVDRALGGVVLANACAQTVLCQQLSPQGACGQCKSCLLLHSQTHPDLHIVEPDGNQIKVDQIRQLCQQLTQTAQQGGARVAIIVDAERLNIAAANALLKTLEEPGDGVMLILQTNRSSQLLPTITSRCQTLAFTPPSKVDIQQWLAEQRLLPQPNAQGKVHDVTWCISVVGGPLSLANSLRNQNYQQLLTYRQDWAQSLQSGHLCNSLLNLSEQQIVDALNVLYLYLRQYVLKSNSKQQLHTAQTDLTGLNPLVQAKILDLAGRIMQMRQKLETMPSVNTQALCQQYVLAFKKITH
ncbi:DNA polymerase III subunit delta' [Shewanella inventionis]|uniref:DNA-directed DNA polymerase n=1 Tax=Shewanella inventionis TaxID=1738770 RepID=A0ABQ1ISI4_9GAMM|nr:DNA polymerase III subunit delta' [Shewanella inventionis]MCL1157174.1 DNA polymerase III subunit delta' [Shewanella inventionis]UAL41966.1 DNA polymerase III subunit delta' [Shewanella inventionis]GGB49263.1 DNA polymerase III subunit delta' [Shewanella inventionis]